MVNLHNTASSTRTIAQIISSIATSDGAGVKLRRSIGNRRGLYLDPFLMLDEFGTDNPGDYIAGFPPHPHRGFETVTYMIDGRMQHKDHLGNVGDLGPGSVQWMTAGKGIIHSEMPLQEEGRMRGFQLWINLPAKEKMNPASYRDIPANDIPLFTLSTGVTVKVIAGTALLDETMVDGPINSQHAPLSTDPLFLDVTLPPHTSFHHAIATGYNALLYPFEGEVTTSSQTLPLYSAVCLTQNGAVTVTTDATGGRFILLAGKPINEPVVQHGPFVMNTREEIEQAIYDYQHNTLV